MSKFALKALHYLLVLKTFTGGRKPKKSGISLSLFFLWLLWLHFRQSVNRVVVIFLLLTHSGVKLCPQKVFKYLSHLSTNTKEYRLKQKQTETDRNGQKRTEMDIN